MRTGVSRSRYAAKRTSGVAGDKDLFVAIIAHELRDPLIPLKNVAHLLKSATFDAAVIEQASRIIDRQVLAMSRLIDDLLDVSRLRFGNLQLRRRQVLVADIVERAVQTARPLVAAHGHTLAVNMPLEPIVIDVDEARVCQVLHNLIGNAVKYTEDGGGRICLQVKREGNDAVMTISDNGIGIAPADLEVIFEPYEQAGRSAGGLGIGLYIARSLVEAHGGTLLAASAGVDRGSEFIMRLPRHSRVVPAAENALPALPVLPAEARLQA